MAKSKVEGESKFKKFANLRVPKAIRAMRSVGALALHAPSEADAKKIINAISEEYDAMEKRLLAPPPPKKEEVTFRI